MVSESSLGNTGDRGPRVDNTGRARVCFLPPLPQITKYDESDIKLMMKQLDDITS